MPDASGTFSLSRIFEAMGIRDKRIIPSIQAGALVPTISFGNIEAFSPQVIEARGFVDRGPFNILAGQWNADAMQSMSKGGTIVERVALNQAGIGYHWNLAPTKPFVGALFQPLTMGGRKLQNIWEESGIQAGAFPLGSLLGGSDSPMNVGDTSIAEGIWVPPGWFFWIVQLQNAAAVTAVRWRELPEGQGGA